MELENYQDSMRVPSCLWYLQTSLTSMPHKKISFLQSGVDSGNQ